MRGGISNIQYVYSFRPEFTFWKCHFRAFHPSNRRLVAAVLRPLPALRDICERRPKRSYVDLFLLLLLLLRGGPLCECDTAELAPHPLPHSRFRKNAHKGYWPIVKFYPRHHSSRIPPLKHFLFSSRRYLTSETRRLEKKKEKKEKSKKAAKREEEMG